ncbi:6028_t:CDS:1, partial [Entrophospora sp. SA101]
AWTSTTINQGHLGVIAHWVDQDWKVKNLIYEIHTGLFLADKNNYVRGIST